MSVSYPTKLKLAFRSGGRCAMPGCGCELLSQSDSGAPVNIGEAAHIAGEKQGSVRYDSNMSEEQRNHCDNLIYLCANCHKKIDASGSGERDYPVKRLLRIKTEHERKVDEAIEEGFSNVGFPELEEVTQWILRVSPQPEEISFSLIHLESKLRKNDLSGKSRRIVTMGLSVAQEVKAFVESMTKTDQNFPERLKRGFLREYSRLMDEGHVGDDLFELMCGFAQRGFGEASKRAASQAVLVYLFEACEVFER